MFTTINGFESINKLTDFQNGKYREVSSMYQSGDGTTTAILKEFAFDQIPFASACELVVVLPDQNVLFRDFMLLPDGSWRDSYGGRRDSLAELLPPELFDLRLVSRNDGLLELRDGVAERIISPTTNS